MQLELLVALVGHEQDAEVDEVHQRDNRVQRRQRVVLPVHADAVEVLHRRVEANQALGLVVLVGRASVMLADPAVDQLHLVGAQAVRGRHRRAGSGELRHLFLGPLAHVELHAVAVASQLAHNEVLTLAGRVQSSTSGSALGGTTTQRLQQGVHRGQLGHRGAGQHGDGVARLTGRRGDRTERGVGHDRLGLRQLLHLRALAGQQVGDRVVAGRGHVDELEVAVSGVPLLLVGQRHPEVRMQHRAQRAAIRSRAGGGQPLLQPVHHVQAQRVVHRRVLEQLGE